MFYRALINKLKKGPYCNPIIVACVENTKLKFGIINDSILYLSKKN